jgi:uncharacterized membrane protein YdjX (TVP38/TMEM64 family)
MFGESIVMALLLAGILTLGIMHMPLWAKRIFAIVPAWIQALVIHFGYGSFLGGVTGHMLGATLSIPMFFLLRYYIQPAIKAEADLANEDRKTMIRNLFHTIRGWFGQVKIIANEAQEVMAETK